MTTVAPIKSCVGHLCACLFAISQTDFVLGFVVGKTVKDQTKNDALPSVLRNVPFPPSKTGVDRTFRFERGNGKWQVNKHSWSDGPEDRILAKPARGQVEVWELENGGGGWSHPIHIHLVCQSTLKA